MQKELLVADGNLEHRRGTIPNELILMAELVLFPVSISLHRPVHESGISQVPGDAVGHSCGSDAALDMAFP